MRTIGRFFSAALVLAMTTGCASKLIEMRPGADQVALATPSQVGDCTAKGKATVSVFAGVSFVSRGNEAVEANLLQMAQNSAVDAGGDTVVKGDSPEFGKRTFSIYKCRR
jgi:hypothetical protein